MIGTGVIGTGVIGTGVCSVYEWGLKRKGEIRSENWQRENNT